MRSFSAVEIDRDDWSKALTTKKCRNLDFEREEEALVNSRLRAHGLGVWCQLPRQGTAKLMGAHGWKSMQHSPSRVPWVGGG